MSKLIQIEGARNCGKTFLVSQLDTSKYNIYKLPFANFFNECYAKHLHDDNKMSLNDRPELFYFTYGYDVTMLDLMMKEIIKTNIITDRGMLSNLVFGVQSKRITMTQACDSYLWLNERYGHCMETVFITGFNDRSDESRNKDSWHIYNRTATNELYEELIKTLDIPVLRFENYFDAESVEDFKMMMSHYSL